MRRPQHGRPFRVCAEFLKGGDEAANAKVSARLNPHREGGTA
ncbi:hypothetical protein RND61_06270 [Streptomyces sp. TRM76323]|uniref:Uncharacterized protein n=1 Tax=Streptomyces tamarix TaxID=3078565 RepID=A0ABU3QH20_9ACTN|nr:hypothetical protein [Streptomyces tamarix]MDT9681682.1 hypothetical protein [Streptomyces tamarix]